MSREILFKAIEKETKELVYGTPIKIEDKVFMTTTDKKIVEIDEDTLCEFTNKYFYDDEDEKIWENDVIEFQGKHWKIQYCPELCGFQGVAAVDDADPTNTFKFFMPIETIREGKFIENTAVK